MEWMKQSRPASDAVGVSTLTEAVAPRWGFAVSSGILGWILDAFDFFVLVFLVDVLANNFHVSKGEIVWTITITLAMRPVGALVLGSLADRYGRRRPLVACVLYFSIITALTPFAPNYAVFVALRGLYGIGMGGYWGIGASLVMESSPKRWRGLFSGIMQAGYSGGYLLAAIALRVIEPRFGWRWMFLCGLLLAAVIAVLTLLAPESASWQKHRLASFAEVIKVLGHHKKDFVYLVLMMTVITCLSHGTQDLYPDFLKTVHKFPNAVVSNLAVLYNIGAILGALVDRPLFRSPWPPLRHYARPDHLCSLHPPVGLRIDYRFACPGLVRDAVRCAGGIRGHSRSPERAFPQQCTQPVPRSCLSARRLDCCALGGGGIHPAPAFRLSVGADHLRSLRDRLFVPDLRLRSGTKRP